MCDYEHLFNQKIRYTFYKFLANLLSGYTDYLQKINLYEYYKQTIKRLKFK